MKQPKTVTIVGPQESVDFPKLGLFGVPAKVDTGADSSAIWATEIVETDGVLQFVLFDRISPYYTGEVLSTNKYSVSSIKNSFGTTEFRYKISLQVAIADRNIRVRFTLANRENNRLPILIGRRTLHGKFLVDVAQPTPQCAKRLLMVSSKKTEAVEAFIAGVKKLSTQDISVTYISYDDVTFLFTTNTCKIIISETGEDIALYDMVHFKTWKERDVSAAMAMYLKKRGVSFLDQRTRYFASNSKLFQYVQMVDNDIPVPPSVFVMPSSYGDSFDLFKETLGLPFVFKATQASRGAHNYLVKDRKMYDDAVVSMQEAGTVAIAQQFIPNEGDYRILVLGKHLSLVIYRSRKDNSTHLNNTSQGGTATLVPINEIPTEIRNKSIMVGVLFELGVAGVDMLQNSVTGEWYCLEVNGDPQMASGSFMAEKQAAYAKYIETEMAK